MATLIVLAAIVVAAAAYLLARPKPMPTGWTAITDGNDYGTKVEADGSFAFPLSPNSVHYVTKGCGSLAGYNAILMSYRVDADPGVTFHDAQTGTPITTGPMLYFQREGDDWTGVGDFESYRWWASIDPGSLDPGEHQISVKLTDLWTDVGGRTSHAQAALFSAALANAARVGFTFPNSTGDGHGIYASGKASFTLLGFALQT